MDYTTELNLSIAAAVAMAGCLAVLLVALAPAAIAAWRGYRARCRARRDIRELARQTIFLSTCARQAAAAGHPELARMYRRGAADAARFAAKLARQHFAGALA